MTVRRSSFIVVLAAYAGGLLTLSSLSSTAEDDSGRQATSPFTAEQRSHWAYQPIQRPAVPQLRSDRVRTPVDAFLLRELESKELTFSRPATKRELLRRAKFDLLGLPPTPTEIGAFLADESPDAYERLIDRLLASPHYGETWGRHWLDLVRFAETAGFNADPIRPLAYKYRDYVVRAFNDDRPYDRFVQEQLAGDELFPENAEALAASGYNRMWPDESNASNVLLARQDGLNDLTGNVGSVFLGLSLGCAQCHDHKFDPILQTDFYEMQAFFVGIVPRNTVPLGTQEQIIRYQNELQAWRQRTEAVRTELHAIERDAKAEVGKIKRLKFPAVVLQAVDTAPELRTAYQHQLVFWSERQIDTKEEQIQKKLSDEQKARRQELKKQLAELKKDLPKPTASVKVMAVGELATGAPKTHRLMGGGYNKPAEELQPAFLTITAPVTGSSVKISPSRPGTSGRRSALARWLIGRNNPLTARVMVNRIWQEHFGKGLVENANDFGTRTAPPSHPELLDWLASEFMAGGWSVKRMHRLMMTSAAYRQSTFRPEGSATASKANRIDPGNRLYWHFQRRRLTAERIRDALLSVSGTLSTKMYGPGVRPPLPPKYSAREAWKVSKDPQDQRRRSVYIYAKRNLRYPLMKAFDLPDMHESCARRAETTVAPQALTLLNSELVLGFAKELAARALRETESADESQWIRHVYSIAYGRQPDDGELADAAAFIEQQRQLIEQPADTAFIDFCHALLNANEFLYLE